MPDAPPNDSPPPATGWRARVPNLLTLLRLALTVWFIAILAAADPGAGEPAPHHWAIWACVMFVVAALTDAADGSLARRWNAVSKFGRIMDPLADKFLILGAFVMLAGHGLGAVSGVAPWMAVTILFRELLVTTARSVFESSGVDFSAVWSGKIKMIVQSIAVPLILIAMAHDAHPGDGPPALAVWSAWAATIATAVSLLPYLVRIAGLVAADPRGTGDADA
jgi:CDP-diacylglycerol--glycerol-3-phosphate 3-phosphatidyltransferase